MVQGRFPSDNAKSKQAAGEKFSTAGVGAEKTINSPFELNRLHLIQNAQSRTNTNKSTGWQESYFHLRQREN